MNRSLLAVLLAAPIAAAGCVSCPDGRSVSLSTDLTPGDLAHYQAKIAPPAGDMAADAASAAPGGVQVEDCTIGLPFLFLPIYARTLSGTADPVPVAGAGAGHHFHFEDWRGLCISLLSAKTTANFDDQGRLLTWWTDRTYLFGVVQSGFGGVREKPGLELPTSHFSVLWGLVGQSQTLLGTRWTFLWITN